jgi:hypothetical protein
LTEKSADESHVAAGVDAMVRKAALPGDGRLVEKAAANQPILDKEEEEADAEEVTSEAAFSDDASSGVVNFPLDGAAVDYNAAAYAGFQPPGAPTYLPTQIVIDGQTVTAMMPVMYMPMSLDSGMGGEDMNMHMLMNANIDMDTNAGMNSMHMMSMHGTNMNMNMNVGRLPSGVCDSQGILWQEDAGNAVGPAENGSATGTKGSKTWGYGHKKKPSKGKRHRRRRRTDSGSSGAAGALAGDKSSFSGSLPSDFSWAAVNGVSARGGRAAGGGKAAKSRPPSRAEKSFPTYNQTGNAGATDFI